MNAILRDEKCTKSISNVEDDLRLTTIKQKNIGHENSSLRYQSGDRSKERAKAHLIDRPEIRKMLEYNPTIKLSKEQNMYVKWPLREHNVLSAPPGSGKTRCLLERIRCMVMNNLVKKNTVFFISFSAPAAEEARERASLYEDHKEWINLENITTIDAIARKVLMAENNPKAKSVELLTLTFTKLLLSRNREELRNTPYIKIMKYVVVDEAQDIDNKQYNSMCVIADKLNATISMAADPNQALYRFRGGSAKFMFQFQSRYNAREFHLTLNYRSSKNIVEFFKGFRSMVFHDIVATRSVGKPVQVIIRERDILHKWLIAFLKNKMNNLERVAILCPTKGTGAVKDVGLSVISNLLHAYGIPFVQHYDESASDDVKSRSRRPINGKINLVTYIGSKGLEWETVIVMDFHALLYNRMPDNMEEYWDQRNLLYVACSRAKDELIICAYRDKPIHPWLSRIDKNTYICDSGVITNTVFPMGRVGKPQVITEISQIVERLGSDSIDAIYNLMNINVTERRLMADRSEIDRGEDDAFITSFTREVLLMQVRERLGKPRKIYSLIESLMNSNMILLKDKDYSILRTFLSRNRGLTWDEFDKNSDLNTPEINVLITNNFNRKIDFCANVISTSEAKKLIDENRTLINEHYKCYINAIDWVAAFKSLFYLVLVMRCIETGHYYHMSNGGRDKLGLMLNFMIMFTELDMIATGIIKKGKVDIEQTYQYLKLGITGRSDLVMDDSLVDIKCGNELYIKHYIQIMLSNFCWKGRFTSTSYIINPIKGAEYKIDISINKGDMWKILNIVSDKCNLRFTNLHVILDLETTDGIYYDGDKRIMPEIIQISMRDYDSGMCIYNHHVRPMRALDKKTISRIKKDNTSLEYKPDISKTKKWLSIQLRNVSELSMYAHNGTLFDFLLIDYYKLLPSQLTILYKDTIPLIFSHYNGKLKSKNLDNLYRYFFNESISDKHSSIKNVNALIRIMKHLSIAL